MVTPVLSPLIYSPLVVTQQSGTSYTLAAADAGTCIEFTSASAVTATIPLNATTPFPIGTVIELCQIGAGLVTVAATGGVTIDTVNGGLVSPGQYGEMYLRKRGTDEWVLTGSGYVPSVQAVGAVATSVAGPNTSFVLTRPACKQGDLLVALIHSASSATTITLPSSSWLNLPESTNGTSPYISVFAYVLRAGASEPSTYTWTVTSTGAGLTGVILNLNAVGGVLSNACATAGTGPPSSKSEFALSNWQAAAVPTLGQSELILEIWGTTPTTTAFTLSANPNSATIQVNSHVASVPGMLVASWLSTTANQTTTGDTAANAGTPSFLLNHTLRFR
jgi:hypothetical protein